MTATTSTTPSLSYTLSSTAVAVPFGSGEKPRPLPPSLLATTAVQTRKGWVGQVAIDSQIVWESRPYKTSGKALAAANSRIVGALRGLLADDA